MRACLAGLLLLACGTAAQDKKPPPIRKDRRTVVTGAKDRPAWARAVAKFTWRRKSRGTGQGTAVLVAPTLVLTAHHCIRNWNGSGTLRFGWDGVARTAIVTRTVKTVLAKSEAGDWAILRLDKAVKAIAPLRMAEKRVQAYDVKRMRLGGYSCDTGAGRGGARLTFDAKCRLRKARTAEGRLLTDAICYYGASGGPAFIRAKDSATWHWIGIVQGNINTKTPRHFVTYVVYQSAYAAALKRALATK